MFAPLLGRFILRNLFTNLYLSFLIILLFILNLVLDMPFAILPHADWVVGQKNHEVEASQFKTETDHVDGGGKIRTLS